MRRTAIAVLSIASALAICASADAATVYVDSSNTAGPWDGTLANPFNKIQAGIDAAVDGDTVLVADGTYTGLVADGTYTGSGNTNLDFRGKAIVVMSESGPEVTIIDCKHTRGFYFHSGEDSTSVVKGFTIENGEACPGGGIYCDNSSPTITHNIFSGNRPFGRYAGYGGGIFCYDSSPTITHNTFSNNSADYKGDGWGGAIDCSGSGSSPTISHNTFFNNSAGYDGGAISCYGSSPTITHNTFYNNSAYLGGGISCHNSSPTITHNTFYNNSGGGIYCRDSSPTITHSTFYNNSRSGIYCENSSLTVRNTILWKDTSGAIYLDDSSTITITYSDIQGGYIGEGNIHDNPLFVDPDNGDYHLHPRSPCIDAGDPNSPLDPDGTRADMGALHFDQSSASGLISIEILPDSASVMVGEAKQFTAIEKYASGDEFVLRDEVTWTSSDTSVATINASGLATVRHVGITTITASYGRKEGTATLIVTPFEETAVVYVDISNIAGPWQGTRGNPFHTIQAAIDAAVYGDTVLVADGVYTGEGNKNLDFGGKAVVVMSENGPEKTIIDCKGDGRGFDFHSGEDSASVVKGFTIQNGSADEGGGIRCFHSSPVITNCTFSYNSANSLGGGISCDNSSPMIIHNIFSGNSTLHGHGGGIYCYDSSPMITNNTLSNNAAGRGGGGIHCDSSFPMIIHNTFSGNSAGLGGGIYCYESSPVIIHNTFSGNRASGGGGICCRRDSSPTVRNTILWEDTPGEIDLDDSSTITITCSGIQGGTGRSWFGTGCIDADPLFVNPARGDYHLQPGSPCIDAGDPNSPQDPDGTRADMGALYFDQSTTITVIAIDAEGMIPGRLERVQSEIPTVYRLSQNYPNPFNPETTVSYDIAKTGTVRLSIYALTGQHIRTLVNGERFAGSYSAIWDGRDDAGRDVASGVYLCRMAAGEYSMVRKMLVAR